MALGTFRGYFWVPKRQSKWKNLGLPLWSLWKINQKNGLAYFLYLLGTQKYPEKFLMPFYAPGPFMFHFLESCKVSFSVMINSYIGSFYLNRKLEPCQKPKKNSEKIRSFRNRKNMWWAWPLWIWGIIPASGRDKTLKLILTICKSLDPVGEEIFLGLERIS